MKKHIKVIMSDVALLVGMVNKIEKVKMDHDAARDRISEAINKVMNGDWGDSNQCMKRGDLIVQLKISETLLNMTYVNLLNLEAEVNNGIGRMNKNIKEDVDRKKNNKKGHKS